jgi:hypothetical protein
VALVVSDGEDVGLGVGATLPVPLVVPLIVCVGVSLRVCVCVCELERVCDGVTRGDADWLCVCVCDRLEDCVGVGVGLQASLDARSCTLPYDAEGVHGPVALLDEYEPFAAAKPDAGTWPITPSTGSCQFTGFARVEITSA